jgi:ABC-type dipeptide/oligopeptide/nickel transport system permease component
VVASFLFSIPGHVDTTLPVRSEGAAGAEAPHQGLFLFYAGWVGRIVRGDLGRTTHGYPVAREVRARVGVTVALSGGAVLVVGAVSFLGALLHVTRRRRLSSRLALTALYVLTGLPTFLVAYLCIAFASPGGGDHGAARFLWPILVLAIGDGLVTELARTLGGGIETELGRPYAEMAVVKGLRLRTFFPWPGTVLFHAFRQAIIQVLPRTALQIQVLVGLSLLVEKIFSLEGLGDMLLDGLGERDVNRVLIVVLAASLLVRAMSLLNDLLIRTLNPRAGVA